MKKTKKCNKRTFKNEESIIKKSKELNLNYYLCKSCFCFHLTSSTKKQPKKDLKQQKFFSDLIKEFEDKEAEENYYKKKFNLEP